MQIFLDDERFPATKDLSKMAICRSFYDFVVAVKDAYENNDPITFISFDHDLGTVKTGYDCAKELVTLDMDLGVLSDNFSFYVHSQNPIGAKNIQAYLENYLEIKKI